MQGNCDTNFLIVLGLVRSEIEIKGPVRFRSKRSVQSSTASSFRIYVRLLESVFE